MTYLYGMGIGIGHDETEESKVNTHLAPSVLNLDESLST